LAYGFSVFGFMPNYSLTPGTTLAVLLFSIMGGTFIDWIYDDVADVNVVSLFVAFGAAPVLVETAPVLVSIIGTFHKPVDDGIPVDGYEST
jgi:hypothetical protein